MLPSGIYAEDVSAKQTLANGTVLHWTSQVGSLYALNAPTDLSICYTNWNDPNILTKATKTLYSYFASCDLSEPDMGLNDSVSNDKASGWTRTKINSPRIEDIYAGVVIANNAGYHYWGYSPFASSKVTDGSGNTARFLLDMDINKMLFKITITAVDKTTLPTTDDYDGNWTSKSISTTTITLKQLYENPSRYLVTSYSWGGALIYGENTSDHWRSVSSIYPAFILDNGDSIGGFIGKSLFGSYQGTTNLSFSTSNGHVSSGGGSATFNICSHLDEKYVMGHPFEFTIKPDPASYQTLGSQAQQAFISKYGDQTASTHTMYVGCNLIDVGDAIAYFGQTSLECQLYFNPDPNLVYRKLHWSWNRYIKGETFLAYLAAFGLYFLNDNSYDPDSDSITPDTLGDTDKIWLGEMLGGGVTTGRWITDLDSYHGPNKDGKTSNPDYNPSGGVTSDEDNNDPVSMAGAPYAAGLVNYYAMTAGSPLINHISDALSTWDLQNTGKDLYKNLVSCKLIKPPAPIPTSGSSPFTIYGEKPQYEGADINLPVVSGNPTATFGPYKVPRKFNDFRDYAPYTRASIYLPYCGWCDLPSHVVGRSVTVYYYTDIIAATVRAVVFCGNNIVAEAAGVMGLDIPFTADAVGMKQAGVVSGLTAYAGGALQTAAGVASIITTKGGKGIGETLSGASKLVSAYTQTAIAFNENTTEISGKNGDGCSLAGATDILIKIIRPKYGANATAPYVPAGYAHSIGFVSNKQVKVGNVSGLLIADNVDTSGIAGATDAERAEIKRVLETGLIVNAAPE